MDKNVASLSNKFKWNDFESSMWSWNTGTYLHLYWSGIGNRKVSLFVMNKFSKRPDSPLFMKLMAHISPVPYKFYIIISMYITSCLSSDDRSAFLFITHLILQGIMIITNSIDKIKHIHFCTVVVYEICISHPISASFKRVNVRTVQII